MSEKEQILQNRLVWIDLEMTGLDPELHVILEIASIVTDEQLRIVAEGPDLAIHHSSHAMESMDEWSRNHHLSSGLLERVDSSPYTCRQAEEKTLAFLREHCQERTSPLCGNSIWQDRRFLVKYMPKLEGFLHYRNIDVSTLKELIKRWYPDLPPFQKEKAHLAMSDIKESIRELQYYGKNIFIPSLTFDSNP